MPLWLIIFRLIPLCLIPTLANATLANHTLQMCLDIKHFSKDILLQILFTHKNPLRPNFIDEHDISENLSFTILLICSLSMFTSCWRPV